MTDAIFTLMTNLIKKGRYHLALLAGMPPAPKSVSHEIDFVFKYFTVLCVRFGLRRMALREEIPLRGKKEAFDALSKYPYLGAYLECQ